MMFPRFSLCKNEGYDPGRCRRHGGSIFGGQKLVEARLLRGELATFF